MRRLKFKNEKYNKLAEIPHKFSASTDDSSSTSKITIYGDIGDYWWESTSASDIEEELKNITSDTIEVHINSPGGDAFDGIAIYNQLKNHPAKIIIYVDGLAASAASVIAMSADELIMNTGSMMMIHEASTITWGTKTDIQKTMNALKGIDKSLADIYMTRFKGEKSELETMIINETWFTSSEAVDVGLADKVNEVVDDEEIDAEAFKDSVLARFRKKEPIAASSKNILERFRRNEK